MGAAISTRLEMTDRVNDWAVRKNIRKTPAITAKYADYIYTKIELLQKTTDLIDSQRNARTDYGMMRSSRRSER